jgi:hypothetical protein
MSDWLSEMTIMCFGAAIATLGFLWVTLLPSIGALWLLGILR